MNVHYHKESLIGKIEKRNDPFIVYIHFSILDILDSHTEISTYLGNAPLNSTGTS